MLRLGAKTYECMYSPWASHFGSWLQAVFDWMHCRYWFTYATAPLICYWKKKKKNNPGLTISLSISLSQHRASNVFPLSHRSMHLHWYELEPRIDPLCLVLVAAHYGNERVTFYRGVKVERRVLTDLSGNKKKTAGTETMPSDTGLKISMKLCCRTSYDPS